MGSAARRAGGHWVCGRRRRRAGWPRGWLLARGLLRSTCARLASMTRTTTLPRLTVCVRASTGLAGCYGATVDDDRADGADGRQRRLRRRHRQSRRRRKRRRGRRRRQRQRKRWLSSGAQRWRCVLRCVCLGAGSSHMWLLRRLVSRSWAEARRPGIIPVTVQDDPATSAPTAHHCATHTPTRVLPPLCACAADLHCLSARAHDACSCFLC